MAVDTLKEPLPDQLVTKMRMVVLRPALTSRLTRQRKILPLQVLLRGLGKYLLSYKSSHPRRPINDVLCHMITYLTHRDYMQKDNIHRTRTNRDHMQAHHICKASIHEDRMQKSNIDKASIHSGDIHSEQIHSE